MTTLGVGHAKMGSSTLQHIRPRAGSGTGVSVDSPDKQLLPLVSMTDGVRVGQSEQDSMGTLANMWH